MKLKRTLVAACLVALLTPGLALAAPTAKLGGDGFNIKEGVTDEILAQIKSEKGQIKSGQLAFRVDSVKDEDLKKLCEAYPEMTGLIIEKGKEITTLAPLAGLKQLRLLQIEDVAATDFATHIQPSPEMLTLRISVAINSPNMKWMSAMTKVKNLKITFTSKGEVASLEGFPSLPGLNTVDLTGSGLKPKDLAPLATALPNLKKLNMTGSILPDLTPLGTLSKLEDLNLYGATLKDFSPLAACAALKKIMYYAVKGADFNTLGALTQVVEMKGGLTELADISWVANLPNLKKFDVFAEYVVDYSPLTKTNIEEFQIWDMRKPVGDLGFLGEMKSLKKLTLWSTADVRNFAPMAALTGLNELNLKEVNFKSGDLLDLSFLAGMKSLTKLEISKARVTNFDAIATAKSLTTVRLMEMGKVDCVPVGKLPVLKTLDLYKVEPTNLEGLAASTTLEGVSIRDLINFENLDPFKKIPNLKRISGVKGKFPEDQIASFPETIKVN
jgi:hypothetical protein